MTAQPFMTFPVRGKKDAIRARHRARQVAPALNFPVAEQACIAAGAFAIACQAVAHLGRFRLCFQIEANQLHVFARAARPASPHAASEDGTLLRLTKPLPQGQSVGDADLAWLVQNGDDPMAGLFDEVVRQNQEVLALLHELVACRKRRAEEGEPAPAQAA